jgi:hypothetical protein
MGPKMQLGDSDVIVNTLRSNMQQSHLHHVAIQHIGDKEDDGAAETQSLMLCIIEIAVGHIQVNLRAYIWAVLCQAAAAHFCWYGWNRPVIPDQHNPQSIKIMTPAGIAAANIRGSSLFSRSLLNYNMSGGRLYRLQKKEVKLLVIDETLFLASP